ncbi:hypothetical protein ABZ319_02720 [Nocardia sp. NPDC005978]|uniref:hypothetical protein n=1 Tax=Nocardia sp. NPDC005978 TaxID=3156725 RepID=UPI0033B7EC0E
MSPGYRRPDDDTWTQSAEPWSRDSDPRSREAESRSRDGEPWSRDAGRHVPDADLWSQVTDVFEPIRDDYAPTGDPEPGGPAATRQSPRRPPARARSQAERAGLIALAAVVLVALAVGTFFTTRHFMGPSDTGVAAAPTVTETTPPPVTTTSAQSKPPAAGAALSSVLTWIKAGTPADDADFHTVTNTSGVTSDLGSAVAFTSPTGKIRCMTPKRANPQQQGLTCMADLDNPPERPSKASGNWVGNWIDYPGATLGIGRMQGDPGQFTLGDGHILTYGSRLDFDDYVCRMDNAGLFCVNESAGTGVQFSSAGPVAFGCLSEYTSKQYGLWYSCEAPVPTTTSAAPTTTATTPSGSAGPVVAGVEGQPCKKAGQRGRAPDGTGLFCDAAGGSGLRWFVE